MKRDWIQQLFIKEQIQASEKRVTEMYYDENGKLVFTEHYLAKRGKCCGNGCKHCPYDPKHQKGNTNIYNKDLL